MNKEALKKISILGVALGLTASPLAFAQTDTNNSTVQGAGHEEVLKNQPRGAAAPTGNKEEWQEGGGEEEGPVVDVEDHERSHTTGHEAINSEPRGLAAPTGNKEEWQEGGGEDEGPVVEADSQNQTHSHAEGHEAIDSEPRGTAAPTGNKEEWEEGGGEEEGPVVE